MPLPPETDEHLHRCLIYVDLNMIRANEYRSPFQSFKPFHRFAPFKTFQINGRSKFKVRFRQGNLVEN
jgi:hypothetical protein